MSFKLFKKGKEKDEDTTLINLSDVENDQSEECSEESCETESKEKKEKKELNIPYEMITALALTLIFAASGMIVGLVGAMPEKEKKEKKKD